MSYFLDNQSRYHMINSWFFFHPNIYFLWFRKSLSSNDFISILATISVFGQYSTSIYPLSTKGQRWQYLITIWLVLVVRTAAFATLIQLWSSSKALHLVTRRAVSTGRKSRILATKFNNEMMSYIAVDSATYLLSAELKGVNNR